MLWFVVVSCLYSHTYTSNLYCYAWQDQQVSSGLESEAACDRWATEFLTEKYNLHRKQFEWGYKCVQRLPDTPYNKPKNFPQAGEVGE